MSKLGLLQDQQEASRRMNRARDGGESGCRNRPKIGERFNPFKRFTGLFVPEPLARYEGISPGAKLVFGRLARYAGKNGECWPSVEKLASEVGLGERMTRKHLAELKKQGFIETEPRFESRRQTSSWYFFRWHEVFDEWRCAQETKEGMNDSSPSPLHQSSASPVNDSAHKDSHIQENRAEETCRRYGRVNSHSRRENHTGECDPVHLDSPKESQGDHEYRQLAEERKRRLQAVREDALAVAFGDLSFYSDES
jgi:hypothetical protein